MEFSLVFAASKSGRKNLLRYVELGQRRSKDEGGRRKDEGRTLEPDMSFGLWDPVPEV
jgi:hypothetical protein